VDVVIITWQGGGASQPAIGLGRLLAALGHRTRIVAPAAFADRVRAAGCAPRSHPPEIEFDPGAGRIFEDQDAHAIETFFGRRLGDAVASELSAEPADVVVIDGLLRGVLSRTEAVGTPTVVLTHMTHRHHGQPVDERTEKWSQRWQYEQVNRLRSELGMVALPVGPHALHTALVSRATAAIVVMTREFDPWPDPPTNVTHVGPIFEEASSATWDSPWRDDDPRPLVVISMSTMYMRQEDVLLRVATASAAVGARTLVLTGFELAPEEVPWPPGVVVRRYVPHTAVLPGAALVIGHGGMGTLMAAFAAGVPSICMPLGRDQTGNAQRAAELRAGVTVAPDATAAELRAQIHNALHSAELRVAAGKMARSIERHRHGARAVAVIENISGGPQALNHGRHHAGMTPDKREQAAARPAQAQHS
jgi:MGT family glycosyltransferase